METNRQRLICNKVHNKVPLMWSLTAAGLFFIPWINIILRRGRGRGEAPGPGQGEASARAGAGAGAVQGRARAGAGAGPGEAKKNKKKIDMRLTR